MNMNVEQQSLVGRRVIFVRDVDRFPHFVVESGETGVVTVADGAIIAVGVENTIDGAEEWDNEVYWYEEHVGGPTFLEFEDDVRFMD